MNEPLLTRTLSLNSTNQTSSLGLANVKKYLHALKLHFHSFEHKDIQILQLAGSLRYSNNLSVNGKLKIVLTT